MHKVIIFIFVFAVFSTLLYKCGRYTKKETITTKVVDKERITKSDGDGNIDSYYLIFTEAGTYKLEDELMYLNFNSSDWYGKLRSDSTYTFDVIGYRIGFLSEYPNIVGIKGLNK
jgi:hypothetical protein